MKINNEKPWQISKGQKTMDDVLLAKGFIRDIGGPGKVTAIIGKACDFLQKAFPHHKEPKKQWTERRLWEWWNEQSELVRHWQMMELYRAAEKAKEERRLIAEARRDHAEFIAKTVAFRSLLERTDADFFGPEIEGLGGVMGRGDRTGNSGEQR